MQSMATPSIRRDFAVRSLKMYSVKNNDFIHLLLRNNPCTQHYCGYSKILPYHSTVTPHNFLFLKQTATNTTGAYYQLWFCKEISSHKTKCNVGFKQLFLLSRNTVAYYLKMWHLKVMTDCSLWCGNLVHLQFTPFVSIAYSQKHGREPLLKSSPRENNNAYWSCH